MNPKTKILIVEDEWLIAEVIQNALEKMGFEITSVVASGEEAIEKVREDHPDLVLMDIVLMGKIDGIEAAKRIGAFSDVPIIFQTAYSDEKIIERAKPFAPYGYLIKPVNQGELYATVKMALYKHGMDKKLREKQRALALALEDSEKMREALENSEARFRAVAESAIDAIISIDGTGNIVSWNKSAEKTFGFSQEEAVGRSLIFIMPERFREAHKKGVERVMAGGEFHVIGKTVELTGLRKDGSEFPLELSLATWEVGGKRFFTGLLHDITGRKKKEMAIQESLEELQRVNKKLQKAQALLVRQEKLVSLGTLSAGVAHEIKNPLNIISTSVQLLQMEENIPEETRDAYATIIQQVNRAAKITENLRDFAREKKPEIKEIELHSFLNKTLALVEYEMNAENLQIERKFHPEPLYFPGDPDQLAQVFLNMVSNARDSMNQKQKRYGFDELQKMGWKGFLTVETGVAGSRMFIRFRDTGVGLKPEVKKKIFDPFFTTKEEGKGTGLGLSIAYGIIESHGGTIGIEGEEGQGAEFTVTLPMKSE